LSTRREGLRPGGRKMNKKSTKFGGCAEGDTMKTLAIAQTGVLRAVGFAVLAGVSACTASATGSGAAPSNASNDPAVLDFKVQQCHDACDLMKTFSCDTALDHATCYADCKQATSDQLDEFNGCVRASGATCDPACSTKIQPKPGGGNAGGGTGGGGSGG